MDLIYTDANRIEQGEIADYAFDLAYGYSENDFELEMPIEDHCCSKNCFIYIRDTEYGGIVDGMRPDAERGRIAYTGRTFHGILENRIIEPDKGYDYAVFNGDANEVIAEIIERLQLSDLFYVPETMSGIEVVNYQMPRYIGGYTGIMGMLAEVDAKLRLKVGKQYVRLSAESIMDYTHDEEFDASQVNFSIERNLNPTNHIICAGQGNLAERYIIHLYTDENGGLIPYSKVDMPLKDADYILDRSQQQLFGVNAIDYFYDFPNAQVTYNYELLKERPKDWNTNFSSYYTPKIDEGEDGSEYATGAYEKVEGKNTDSYRLLTGKPADWAGNYDAYYVKSETTQSGYSSVRGEEKQTYVMQQSRPADWVENYSNYYERYQEGLSEWEYRSVSGIQHYKYCLQTQKPTDWKNEYSSFYMRKKGKYVTVPGKKSGKKTVAPAWKAKKYYTRKELPSTAPAWIKGKYCTGITSTVAPVWAAGRYYEKLAVKISPNFASGMYYRQLEDHYAAMIKSAIEKLKEKLLDADKVGIDLNGYDDVVYDINDLVGARDAVTGLETTQPVTKKIVTIENGKQPVISYTIGEKEK